VIKRDDSGDMRPSGEHQCVGCKMIFTDVEEWRGGGVIKGAPTQNWDEE
jgi:hypothetical protein